MPAVTFFTREVPSAEHMGILGVHVLGKHSITAIYVTHLDILQMVLIVASSIPLLWVSSSRIAFSGLLPKTPR